MTREEWIADRNELIERVDSVADILEKQHKTLEELDEQARRIQERIREFKEKYRKDDI